MVRVGEASGTLDAAFLRLCEYLGTEQDVHDRVQSAMRYPLIVVARRLRRGRHHLGQSHPRVRAVFRMLGDHIPLPTRLIMGASALTRDYWWLMLLRGRRRRAGLARVCGHRCGTLSLASRQGASAARRGAHARGDPRARDALVRDLSGRRDPGVAGLRNDRAHDRQRLRERSDPAPARHVERGDSISRAAATAGLFPPLVVQMFAVGEETGELAALLDEVGRTLPARRRLPAQDLEIRSSSRP